MEKEKERKTYCPEKEGCGMYTFKYFPCCNSGVTPSAPSECRVGWFSFFSSEWGWKEIPGSNVVNTVSYEWKFPLLSKGLGLFSGVGRVLGVFGVCVCLFVVLESCNPGCCAFGGFSPEDVGKPEQKFPFCPLCFWLSIFLAELLLCCWGEICAVPGVWEGTSELGSLQEPARLKLNGFHPPVQFITWFSQNNTDYVHSH